MNPNDKLMIENLSKKIKQAQPVTKDPNAQALINQEIAGQPDALYLLTQAVLLQEEAIKQLQQQVSELQQQNSRRKGGLFSSVFGQQRQQAQPQSMPYQQPSFGQGSFLQSALSTAAGVAGGMMLFNGISHLFSSADHTPSHSDSMFSSSPLVENMTDNQDLSDGFGENDMFTDSNISDGDFFDDGGFDGGGDDLF